MFVSLPLHEVSLFQRQSLRIAEYTAIWQFSLILLSEEGGDVSVLVLPFAIGVC